MTVDVQKELKNTETCELVDELAAREGVEEHIIDLDNNWCGCVEGPARILIIRD